MNARILFSLDIRRTKNVRFLEFNNMHAVSLHKCGIFNQLVYLYAYGIHDRVCIEKAYAWQYEKPDTIVYLQEDEKKAKVITQAEYETYEVFQNDQNA